MGGMTIREVETAADYEAWRQVRIAVYPYERTKTADELRARAAWTKASTLATEPRILDVFEGELEGAGVVGERRFSLHDLQGRNKAIAQSCPRLNESWAARRIAQRAPQRVNRGV